MNMLIQMVKRHRLVAITFVLAVLMPHTQGTEPSAEEVRKIWNAIPEQATVQSPTPRKLLVFSRAWGYKHSSIPYGRVMAKAMADKTKAFTFTHAEDLSWFEWDKLKEFDAIFFNNTNNEIFLPENVNELPPDEKRIAEATDKRLKQNLVRFLSEGKGLAVIHAGVASFRLWPEYGNIIGARFDNHPWNAGSTIQLHIEDPSHALCQCFDTSRFEVTDEIYQFKEYDRSLLRVLFRIDTNTVNVKTKSGVHRTDGDFALSWIKPYGKGRIYYSALGHQHDIFWNKTIVRSYLDGIQYALGDIKADTTSLPLND